MRIRNRLTTNSPFPVSSPFRTFINESSFSPFPNVALWMSVAKKHTDESTRESNAAFDFLEHHKGYQITPSLLGMPGYWC